MLGLQSVMHRGKLLVCCLQALAVLAAAALLTLSTPNMTAFWSNALTRSSNPPAPEPVRVTTPSARMQHRQHSTNEDASAPEADRAGQSQRAGGRIDPNCSDAGRLRIASAGYVCPAGTAFVFPLLLLPSSSHHAGLARAGLWQGRGSDCSCCSLPAVRCPTDPWCTR